MSGHLKTASNDILNLQLGRFSMSRPSARATRPSDLIQNPEYLYKSTVPSAFRVESLLVQHAARR